MLLRFATTTGYSQAILTSLHSYAALLSLFDTIRKPSKSPSIVVVVDSSLILTWIDVLLLASREHDYHLITQMLELFTHITSSCSRYTSFSCSGSVVAIMRERHLIDALISVLHTAPQASSQSIIQSLFHVFVHSIDDPSPRPSSLSLTDLSSLLSPSHLVVLIKSSYLNPSIMSFALHLFILCLPRCASRLLFSHVGSIETITLCSQQLSDALAYVIGLFNTSSNQDRGVQQDVFFIVKQLTQMGGIPRFSSSHVVLLPLNPHASNVTHLLHELFLSYMDGFRCHFLVELQARSRLSFPLSPDSPTEIATLSARHSYVTVRRRSSQKPSTASMRQSIRSQPEMNSLLTSSHPHPICIDKTASPAGAAQECIVLWEEDYHGSAVVDEDEEFHFGIANFECRCKACSRNRGMDEVEVFVGFLDFLFCLASPSGDGSVLTDISTIISFDDLAHLKRDIVKILHSGDSLSIWGLNNKVEQLLQIMDRKRNCV